MINYKLLRQRRREKEITIAEVAHYIGLKTPTGYWHIEQGHTRVTVEQLYKLSQLVGVSCGDLVEPKEENEYEYK